ncbi:TonB-dependent receptor [Lichenicola cladoniae]|nr:TonB-dependent receptor [Lichenicola cladoniae]
MMQTPKSPSHRRLLHGATAMIVIGLSSTAARSQVPATTTPSGIRPDAGSQAPNTQNGNTAGNVESVTVRAQRRLLREKDAPSAVTELGTAQISQTSVGGSVATLLRAAPSVYVYQQGIGNNEPVLTVRGVRGLEVAQTLDGVPMQDLLSGGSGSYLSGILGGHFNLDQIGGVSVYPGVAYPDKSTFGTIGGTIAYTSLRPENKAGADLFGSIGSFGTWNEGFDVNSGRMDGILGTGVDAPKMMLKYSNLQTKGFVDYTPARYNNMSFAFDKPYDQGQSLFQTTVNYNTGSGLTTPEPLPLPYLQQNGDFSNYSPDQQFQRQYNDYFTLIMKNDTYINDYISAGVTGSYLYSDTYSSTYGNPSIFAPNGEPGSVAVGGANPFNQTIAGFGEQSAQGFGNPNYDPTAYPYNPDQTKNCPAATTAQFAAAGATSPCGYNSSYTKLHSDSYILQPRVTITPPRIWGIDNTIKIGGLLAKETEAGAPNGSVTAGQTYYGTTSEFAHTPANLTAGFDGGVQRTIYEGYAQDKIDFLDNTLHFTPGVTLQTSDTSLRGSKVLGGTPTAADASSDYCLTFGCSYGSYKIHKWDRTWLPFANVSYDLDKILPPLRGVSLYASYGTSAIFAPVQDYGVNAAPGAGPPNASIVHMYEAGVKYNRRNLSLSIDYFYQHITRDFGFFQNQEVGSPGYNTEIYSNDGQREMKGFEAAGIWQVSPDFQLFGNVSYTLAKYLKTTIASVTAQEDQFGLAVRGSPITGIPDWISTFGVDYDHHSMLLSGDEFNARFEGQYTGKQQTTIDLDGFTNIGPIPGLPAAFGSYQYYNNTTGQTTYNKNGGISPFAIFNLDLNYKMPVHGAGPLTLVDFDLNVLNIFNTRYFQYFYNQVSPAACGKFTSGPFKGQQINSYGCSTAFNDALPGEPAAITFSVRAHF